MKTSSSPSSWTDEDELPLGQQLVQSAHHLSDVSEILEIFEVRISVRVDVNDVADVGDTTVRDASMRREQQCITG